MWLFIATLFLTQAAANSEDVIEHTKGANPETFMNISQMICYRGYPSEEYEVLTRDGYYVRLNRIPHGREKPGNGGPKLVVFLQHGLLGEGSNWVENLSNNSLGFILADSGYDVWLGNSRGTRWSQRHQHLSTDQVEFWDFSFHEMAMYDLPAMINFVLRKTGQKQIYYVGYSQGATIAFIAFSSMPELAQKVKMFFALAPAVIIKHAKSPVMKMSFLLDRQFKIFQTRLDVYTAHYPDRTSVKNMIHWAQGWVSLWGFSDVSASLQETPPSYQLEKMPVPTALWSGGEDWAVDWRDVQLLLPRIAHVVSYVHIADWNHWDFIWGLDAPGRLYSHILALMERPR
uniref:Partial AB-hydrolase lipase domain-containing protein n=1 Tax=Anser brachyrhynchus TaxID=132585 RepID=A0A8B9CUK7_9AVES